MSDDPEDSPPSHRLEFRSDPEASISTGPPPAEPGTEASAVIPPPPRLGPVGLETVLAAIREFRDSTHARIDEHGEGVTRVAKELATLSARVSGFENAMDRRRLTDNTNQGSMRESIHGLGTRIGQLEESFDKFAQGVDQRLASFELRMDDFDRRLGDLEVTRTNGG